MPKIDTGPWEINYIEEGAGPPVVLIHGLAGDHRAWRPQIEALAGAYRVIALDNPGSGASGPVTAPVTLAEIAAAVISLMEQLKLGSAHLVGRSMGGAIAQEIAFAAPHLVKSLTLAGSFARLDRLGERLIENMRDFISADPDWRRWTRQFSFTFVSPAYFLADAERMARLEAVIADERRDVTSYVNLANACLASNTVGRLRRVGCPVLALAGRLDPICSPLTTQWIADELPTARIEYFEDSSHFFLMEEAPKVNAVLGGWLAQVEKEQSAAAGASLAASRGLEQRA